MAFQAVRRLNGYPTLKLQSYSKCVQHRASHLYTQCTSVYFAHPCGEERRHIKACRFFHHCLSLQEGLTKHQRNYHWDKRKRQYIQLQPGEQVVAGKRLKTESGKSVKGKTEASGLYKKWSRAHQARVMPVGQKEDEKSPYVPGIADR